jgi:hypothetical protein
MATNVENLSAIRHRLGDPNPHQPSDVQLLNIYIDHIANHCAQLQNTRSHWLVGRWTLPADANTEDYPVTAEDFGRPFLVYTTDDADSFHVRREVPFSLLQDADQRYQGPQQTQQQRHSAVEISFYRQGPASPQWYARLTPIPGGSATYEVFYEAKYTFGALADSPGLDLFYNVVRVQTALSALPLCAWGDISIKQNPDSWQMQAKALRDVLLHDEAIFQKQFDSYRAQSTREGVSRKRGEGWQHEADMLWGGCGVLDDPTYI